MCVPNVWFGEPCERVPIMDGRVGEKLPLICFSFSVSKKLFVFILQNQCRLL